MKSHRNKAGRPRARRERRNHQPSGKNSTFARALRCEQLEDRRLLAVVTVNTPLDVVDFTDGVISLREAIFATNLVAGADEIVFDFADSGPHTIQLTQGQLKITDALTISGPGVDLLTIDAQLQSRIFEINNSNDKTMIDVTIDGVKLLRGSAGGLNGGAILSLERLTVRSAAILAGKAEAGAGISSSGELTVEATTISSNTATGRGGAISATGSLWVNSSQITFNAGGKSGGGGIYFTESGNGPRSLRIDSSTIANNSAASGGGVVAFLAQSDGPGERSVVVTNSTISGNRATSGIAGGLYLRGGSATPFSITDNQITYNQSTVYGGGIYVQSAGGSVVIARNSVSGNTATRGGGGIFAKIRNSTGTVLIDSNTINNNFAGMRGGGLLLSTIFAGSSITVTNSTVSGNASAARGGGIQVEGDGGGPVTIKHSTIANNITGTVPSGALVGGGGIHVSFTTTSLLNTIVAGNTDLTGTANNVGGTVTSSYSLIDTGAAFLGPLADNGGPTKTHALLPGSPAINAGDPNFVAPPDSDQRGFPFTRVSGGRIDIGAFEAQPLPGDFDQDQDVDHADLAVWEPGYGSQYTGLDFLAWQLMVQQSTELFAPALLTTAETVEPTLKIAVAALEADTPILVTTHLDVVDFADGLTSLREAIFAANLVPGAQAIEFAKSLTGKTILLTHGELKITDSLTITGLGANLLTIDASGNDQSEEIGDGSPVFHIDNGDDSTLIESTISGMTITGSDTYYDDYHYVGGAISSHENLHLKNTVITGNQGQVSAISVKYGNLSIANSTISENASAEDHDATISVTGDLSVVDSVISGNRSEQRSGYGVVVVRGRADVLRSSIIDNSFFRRGGAALSVYGPLTMIDSVVSGNQNMWGVSLVADSDVLPLSAVDNCVISSNGLGGLFVDIYPANEITVRNTTISDNSGTGIQGSDSPGAVHIIGSTISGNTATRRLGESYGRTGGIALYNATVSILDTVVSDNIGFESNSGFSRYSSGGGGIHIRTKGEVTISRTSVVRNSIAGTSSSVQRAGGGITLENATTTITDCDISNNSSPFWAGGLRIINGITTINRSSITGNTARYIGGGIYFNADTTTSGTLNVVDTLVGHNSAADAGGIGAGGTTNIVRSTISNNSALGGDLFATGRGGGVRSALTVNFVDSTIENNTAASQGGGVFGHARIISSTVANNSAEQGGGVWTSGGVIEQSTITSNHAAVGAGVYVARGVISTIDHSTLAFNSATGNAGGIFVDGAKLNLDHTIVARNTGTNPDLALLIGSTVTVDYSLIGLSTGSGLTPAPLGSPDAHGNLIGGSNASNPRIDPRLAPLADNGGPTKTHALLSNSPAINAGDPNFVGPPDSDQRGFPYQRVSGGRIDIGAFEVQPLPGDFDHDNDVDHTDLAVWEPAYGSQYNGLDFLAWQLMVQQPAEVSTLEAADSVSAIIALEAVAPILVTTNLDVVDFSDSLTSLREAIFAANLVPGAQTIEFAASLSGKTILLTHGELEITDSVTITGLGANLLTIDASGNDLSDEIGDGSSVFHIDNGDDTTLIESTISGMTITGSDSYYDRDHYTGGAISSHENLHLENTVITGNQGHVSAILVRYGNLSLANSTISENVSVEDFDNATISVSGDFSAVDSVISGNSAERGFGYGVVVVRGRADVLRCSIVDNTVPRSGGGALFVSGPLTMADSVITGNQGMWGVNVAQYYSILPSQIDNCVISNNGRGGLFLIISGGSEITVRDTTVSDNAGSGIRNIDDPSLVGGAVHIIGSTISGNAISNSPFGPRTGGGGVTLYNASVSIVDTVISGNLGYGTTFGNIGGDSFGAGGVSIANSPMAVIERSSIHDNVVKGLSGLGPGGGITLFRSTATISDSIISNNDADLGGGIFSRYSSTSVLRTTIAGNTATRIGGGISSIDFQNGSSSPLSVVDSIISDNTAGDGGGISSGRSNILRSTIRNNAAIGHDQFISGRGGGINGLASIIDSTIEGNTAATLGGGVYAVASIDASTIVNNTADAGGGVWMRGGVIEQSTVSANHADVGAGVYVAKVTPSSTVSEINHSTIAFNVTSGIGGGVYADGASLALDHTIIARNTGINPDLALLIGSTITAHYSLVANNSGSGLTPAPIGSPDANGNIIGVFSNTILQSLFAPLADNGGPTQTHALLPGSPAINAGDFNFIGPPDNDQRGFPYKRVSGGRIDIGAFEAQPLPGDFDHDQDVDHADLAVWEPAYGSQYNGLDFLAWQLMYQPPAEPLPLSPALIDLAMAVELNEVAPLRSREAIVADAQFSEDSLPDDSPTFPQLSPRESESFWNDLLREDVATHETEEQVLTLAFDEIFAIV